MKKLLIPLILTLLPALASAAPSNIWERAAYGDKPGITSVTLAGINGGITTTFEPLWPQSAAYTFLAANASTPYIASSDANDDGDPEGSGARTVRVTCVDANFAETSETLTMNGQTSVNLTISCMSVNRLEVITAGSGGVNAGIIRVGTGTNTGGVPAVVHGHIAIGQNQSQSAIYTVPSGYTLLCRNFSISSYGVTAAQTVQVAIDRYVNKGILKREYLGHLNQAGSSSDIVPAITKFAEKSQIAIQALSAASTGPVSVRAECIQIKNTWVSTAQDLF